jgi:uncharacterized protein (TIGR02246 family)
MSTEIRPVVDRFNQAWNDHDLDAALALTTSDVVFDATSPAPDGAHCVGQDAVRAAWQPIFEDARSRFDVEDAFVTGDRLVQLWRFDWGDGHVRGIDVIRVVNGLVAEKLSYVKG